MRIHVFTIVSTLAAAAATAQAKPRRVVVQDFEGPRLLADAARSQVLNVLGDQYDMVPPKKWEQAKMQAPQRGPQQWSAAAKSSGADAVIEGWVDPEGMRTHTMTIVVRNASTGIEVDSFEEKIGDKGMVTADTTRDMTTKFDQILSWVDADPTASDVHAPFVSVDQQPPLVGSSQPRADAQGDDDDDDDDGDDRPAPRHKPCHKHHGHCTHHARKPAREDRSSDDDRRASDDDRRSSDRERGDDHRSSDRGRDDDKRGGDDGNQRGDQRDDQHDKSDKQVAASDPAVTPGVADVVRMFGPNNPDTDLMLDRPAPHTVHPSPRFAVEAGIFVASRGMGFSQDADPSYPADPPSYPATGLYGMTFSASVFPRPTQKYGNDLTGLGFTFSLSRSIGAQLDTYDSVADQYGSYDLDYTAYEGAVHYRYPLGIVMLDGQVNYGRDSWTFEELSPNVQIPDVSYQYIGAGGDIDLAVTDRTRVGFGARYMYILDAGDVSDESWYGSGTASGLALDAHFQIPLGDLMYLKGGIEYRRISMSFEGSGDLSTTETDTSLGVSSITDSSISGTALIGVQF